MRTLFLHPPSFDGLRRRRRRPLPDEARGALVLVPDLAGAAGRALVEGSKLIDAPPHGLSFEDIVPEIKDHDLIVMHTSTPSFKSDARTAEMIKAINPGVKIGFIGAKVAVEPEKSLKAASAVDFVARNEFDFTIKEVAEGRRLGGDQGPVLPQRRGRDRPQRGPRRSSRTWTQLPFVTPVYKRDLDIEDYFIGYLKHPYLSLYTGPRLQVALHLLPVAADRRRPPLSRAHRSSMWSRRSSCAEQDFPQVKEFFFDDDTFTDNLPRVEAIARGARQARRHLVVQRQGERAARDAEGPEGQWPAPAAGRLRVRQPADPAQHQEGHAGRGRAPLHQGLPRARHRRSTAPSSSACPGETRETIQETIEFAKEINPHTIQVSLAAPYPGTFLYRQAKENGWLDDEDAELLTERGHADRAAELSASEPHRDLRVGRGLLQEVLFPPVEDRLDRRRDGRKPRR